MSYELYSRNKQKCNSMPCDLKVNLKLAHYNNRCNELSLVKNTYTQIPFCDIYTYVECNYVFHYLRKKMGKYCSEVRRVALELMGAITESLGLGSDYLGNRMEEGMQVMAVNCYPPCPEPEVALGLPPHSDYSCLTILLQSLQGLEILDKEDGNWKVVPELHGALQVHVGDHLEVLSNGRYKSVVHRATLNSDKTRVSITSLHSLGMDDVMGAAMELVDNQNPLQYKESSFRDFLDFLSSTDISGGKRFIDTIRLEK